MDTFNGFEVYIKLAAPLPTTITEGNIFRFAEEVSNPIELTIELGSTRGATDAIDTSIHLQTWY